MAPWKGHPLFLHMNVKNFLTMHLQIMNMFELQHLMLACTDFEVSAQVIDVPVHRVSFAFESFERISRNVRIVIP